MSTKVFETLPPANSTYGPIPIHPQPGIFETTIAMVKVPDHHNDRAMVTHVEIEEILHQPAWDIETYKAEVFAKYGPVEGWARTGKAQKDHFFPMPYPNVPGIPRLSLCETRTAEHGIVLTEDGVEDAAPRCRNCTDRLEIRKCRREYR